VPNEKVMNWKDLEESGHGLILRYYNSTHLEELRKTMKNWSPG
jgi:hypothetical protein